ILRRRDHFAARARLLGASDPPSGSGSAAIPVRGYPGRRAAPARSAPRQHAPGALPDRLAHAAAHGGGARSGGRRGPRGLHYRRPQARLHRGGVRAQVLAQHGGAGGRQFPARSGSAAGIRRRRNHRPAAGLQPGAGAAARSKTHPGVARRGARLHVSGPAHGVRFVRARGHERPGNRGVGRRADRDDRIAAAPSARLFSGRGEGGGRADGVSGGRRVTAPRRRLKGAADGFERALLRSARLDEPRERSVLETAAALGVGTARLGATTATSAAAAGSGAAATGAVAAGAAKLTASVLFKYFSVGLAAGLLTVGAFQLSGPPETAPASARPAAV